MPHETAMGRKSLRPGAPSSRLEPLRVREQVEEVVDTCSHNRHVLHKSVRCRTATSFC